MTRFRVPAMVGWATSNSSASASARCSSVWCWGWRALALRRVERLLDVGQYCPQRILHLGAHGLRRRERLVKLGEQAAQLLGVLRTHPPRV